MATISSPKPLTVDVAAQLVIPAHLVPELPALATVPLGGILGVTTTAVHAALLALAETLGVDESAVSVAVTMAGGLDGSTAPDPAPEA